MGRKSYNKGIPMSEEMKTRISLAKKGKKTRPRSQEVKDKISKTRLGIVPWNKGIKMSEYKKQKLNQQQII